MNMGRKTEDVSSKLKLRVADNTTCDFQLATYD